MTTIIRPRSRGTHATVIPRELLALARQGQIHPSHVLPLALAHLAAVQIKSPRNFFRPISEPYVLGGLLSLEGGMVYDNKGNAVGLLHEHVNGVSLGQLRSIVNDLAKDGLIERVHHVGGRATDKIAITDKGRKAIGNQPPGPVPAFWLPGYEPGGVYRPGRSESEIIKDLMGPIDIAPIQAVPAPVSQASDLDPEALARLCLHLGVERDHWRDMHAKAEANIDDLVRRLNDASVEIERLQHLTRHVDASQHGSYPLREALRVEDREQLDRLMRELPVA